MGRQQNAKHYAQSRDVVRRNRTLEANVTDSARADGSKLYKNNKSGIGTGTKCMKKREENMTVSGWGRAMQNTQYIKTRTNDVST